MRARGRRWLDALARVGWSAAMVGLLVAGACQSAPDPLTGMIIGQVQLADERTLFALRLPFGLDESATDGCASLDAVLDRAASAKACVGVLEDQLIDRSEVVELADFEVAGDVMLVAAIVWEGTFATMDCSLGSTVAPLSNIEPGLALLVVALDIASCEAGDLLTISRNGQDVRLPLPT